MRGSTGAGRFAAELRGKPPHFKALGVVVSSYRTSSVQQSILALLDGPILVPVQDIPESVKQLVLARIDSVPELETILLLREHAEHAWTAAETGQRIYVSHAVAAHILSELAARGFLAATESSYRYAPATDELRRNVDDLADAYTHHLVEVTRMIHSKPSASVRQFADAFVLKKDR